MNTDKWDVFMQVVEALRELSEAPSYALLLPGGLMVSSEGPISLLALDGGLPDPVFSFWQLRHEKRLASECLVVFIDIRESPAWADLEHAYGGTKFGPFFFMRYRQAANPGILPSQKGLYMK